MDLALFPVARFHNTTVLVSDFDTVGNVLQLVAKFHQISRLKLNIDKTVAKCIGSLEHHECHNIIIGIVYHGQMVNYAHLVLPLAMTLRLLKIVCPDSKSLIIFLQYGIAEG